MFSFARSAATERDSRMEIPTRAAGPLISAQKPPTKGASGSGNGRNMITASLYTLAAYSHAHSHGNGLNVNVVC